MRTLTSTGPLARELRQNSPFLGLLPDAERRAILDAYQRSHGRRNATG
jgi:hypothetical protein